MPLIIFQMFVVKLLPSVYNNWPDRKYEH